MRMTPGIVGRPGDWHLQFELLVVWTNDFVIDRPVGAYSIPCVNLEIRGMEPRSKSRPVHRAAAASTAVVRAQRKRIGAAGDARLFPVKLVGAGLIADPVSFRIPERAGLKSDHIKSCACEPLQQDASGRRSTPRA